MPNEHGKSRVYLAFIEKSALENPELRDRWNNALERTKPVLQIENATVSEIYRGNIFSFFDFTREGDRLYKGKGNLTQEENDPSFNACIVGFNDKATTASVIGDIMDTKEEEKYRYGRLHFHPNGQQKGPDCVSCQ